MQNQKTYTFHQDAGHGWLAVRTEELIDLGILHLVSDYSYQRGKTTYLEEDCDYALFWNAYKVIHGTEPITKQGKYKDRSSIRSYERFSSKAQPNIFMNKSYQNYKLHNLNLEKF